MMTTASILRQIATDLEVCAKNDCDNCEFHKVSGNCFDELMMYEASRITINATFVEQLERVNDEQNLYR